MAKIELGPNGLLDQGGCLCVTRISGQMWMMDLIGVKYTIGERQIHCEDVDGRPSVHVAFHPTGISHRGRGLDTNRPTLLWTDVQTGEMRCRHYAIYLRAGTFHAEPDSEFRVLPALSVGSDS